MEISGYMGNPYQVCGLRRYTLSEGFAKGTEAIDVKTGGGLEYTVLPSRALDISLVSYKGVNLTYLTPGGETVPSYYKRRSDDWLHAFFGGLLTTCGPFNIGRACTSGGREFALHDRFSNTPARFVCAGVPDEDGITVTGQIDFGALGKEKIRVFRTVFSPLSSSSVTITDRIENYGFTESPLTILYHTNWGYPFLTEKTKVYVDASGMECYDGYSAACAADVLKVSPPDPDSKEKNYFHTMNFKGGFAHAAIVNPGLNNLGALLTFNSELKYLTHCKVENPVDYLVALEPCNTLCLGRAEIERRGILPRILPGETKIMSLRIELTEGQKTDEMLKLF